jgi:iron complex transport system substrate-binding protein
MAMKASVKPDVKGQMCILAGGKNIAEYLPEYIQPGGSVSVDPEWVIEQNPDFIAIQFVVEGAVGYGVDDPSGAAAVREEILNNPVFANVNAIKTGNVYLYGGCFRNDASCGITGAAYRAKVFHPDLFEDLDPETVFKEYLELQHFDYDLDEHGMFVYPPIITGEGKLAGIPDRYYDSIIAQP